MLSLLGKRVLHLIPVTVGVSFLTFMLLNLLPGNPALTVLGEGATPEAVAAVTAELGLDDPLLLRYWHWFVAALGGNLGTSLDSGEPVTALLLQRLPASIEIMLLAQLIALVVAVPTAIVSARRPGSAVDRATGLTAFAGVAMPPFLVGMVLVLVVAIPFGLPATGWIPFTENPVMNLRSAFLPALTLAVALYAAYMRVLRADLVTQLTQEDYVTTARAKGLARGTIISRHVLRNAVFPLITVLGINMGALLGGAVIVETLFAVPGLGKLVIDAIYQRDVVVVQGAVLVIAVAFVLINFAVDVLYAALDPRIRHDRAAS
ncbi:ABC transporter permease [Pseudonocardia sp. C8]|uniref:ABC transporter permease n=1 Tax=Pseudonocardia sp. C8 TaxID=2762759 RepID=UPI0016424253|nr:ABC transporter permease [Pseudonocardia sp. C8]MBC3190429.1 ABC transporter permease [Pseudonocardia sp. C8]